MSDHDQPTDELPQQIGDDPHWQESVVLIYYDAKAGIGGFHRIGHEPNWRDGQGKMVSWAGVASAEGVRFARTLQEPFRSEDRLPAGFRCTEAYALDVSDGIRLVIDDGAYKADLIAEDYTPRCSPFPHSGESVTAQYAPQHWETAGRVRGTVELDGKVHQIDGLCYRDHSWGRREWNTLSSHRWVAGTIGPQLTFCAASWQSRDGQLASYAYVCRDGGVEQATSVDIVARMEIDATTNRGGTVTIELASGERFDLDAIPALPGFIAENNGIFCVDQLCTVEHGGVRGFCDFETTTNPRQGTHPIARLVNNADADGVTHDTLRRWGLPR